MENDTICTLEELAKDINTIREKYGMRVLSARSIYHGLRYMGCLFYATKMKVRPIKLYKQATLQAIEEHYKRTYTDARHITRATSQNKENISDLIERGLYNVSMLFGAVNVLRQQQGYKVFETPATLQQQLYKSGMEPVAYGTDHQAWYNPEDAITTLCYERINNKGQKIKYMYEYPEITQAEIDSGEWQDGKTCARLTGATTARISGFIKEFECMTRRLGDKRFYHLPTIQEKVQYRPYSWLVKRYGEEIVNKWKHARKTKCVGDNKLMIYCPELAHL